MTQNHNADQLCINTIRMLAADAVQAANSGHPGMPMGAAAMAYTLWTRFLKHDPADPQWPDRDRFILSAGHGSMLLYSLLHLTGYALRLSELKRFRQWGSKTPGHPEYGLTPGVETTTGPLGQGFANGVGMAVAEKYLAARFNRPDHEIVNHFTYAICSDGELMEGISHEAASLAGHLQLGKLIYLYDDNRISIEGSTSLAFSDDSPGRFKAYGWHVQQVADGNDVSAIEKALVAARAEQHRPSLISVRTCIGFGSPGKQDTAAAHGEPLGEAEGERTKEALGWPLAPSFFIPDKALEHFRQAVHNGKQRKQEWLDRCRAYKSEYPALARQFKQWVNNELPSDWDTDIPFFPPDEKGEATRASSGQVLNAISPRVQNLIGGSADLSPSTKTYLTGESDFQAGVSGGRNFHFGVREHGMGAILSGMALHGGLIPYGATFLIFSDYMRPPIRLASLMKLKVIYIFTHDSIGLGEDGPTHQPVEQLAALRAIPDLVVIRPCDANETAEAWRFVLQYQQGPVALCLTRQKVPTLDRNNVFPAAGLHRGGYVVADFKADQPPDAILIGTGSEVHIALEAAGILAGKGLSIRVVSMPSQELFERQDQNYRDRVLLPAVSARVVIEAGASQGWHRFVGNEGKVVSIDHYGASAPSETLYENFGITAGHVVEIIQDMTGGTRGASGG